MPPPVLHAVLVSWLVLISNYPFTFPLLHPLPSLLTLPYSLTFPPIPLLTSPAFQRDYLPTYLYQYFHFVLVFYLKIDQPRLHFPSCIHAQLWTPRLDRDFFFLRHWTAVYLHLPPFRLQTLTSALFLHIFLYKQTLHFPAFTPRSEHSDLPTRLCVYEPGSVI